MEGLYSLILTYKYAIFLPLTVVEGPIVTVIAAFLSSLGILNIYLVFAIAVLGDLIGDTIYYWIGRFGRKSFIPRYGSYLGITEEKISYAEEHYDKHLLKTLIFGKITQAPILLILVLAGVTKTDYFRFISTVLLVTIPKIFLLSVLGFYFGKSYVLIGQYMDNSLLAMAIILTLAGIAYLMFSYVKKNIMRDTGL